MALNPVQPREPGAIDDAFTAHAAQVGALLRTLGLLARVASWGVLFWFAHAHPALLPAVHGLIAADFVTWIVVRGLRWQSESHPRAFAELIAYAGVLAWWSRGGVLPDDLADRGVFGLAFVAATAVKTLPAVWLRLHGED